MLTLSLNTNPLVNRFADPDDLIDTVAPSLEWTARPAAAVLEESAGEEVIAELKRRGHDLQIAPAWSAGRLTAAERDAEVVLSAPATPRLMQAYAEGFDILRHAGDDHRHENETYKLDLADVAEVWRRGSVISSWLLDLTAAALEENPTLDGLAGRVSDSGEGRWTVKAAVDTGVPAPVLSAALFERFASRDEDHYANQLLSAMRLQFGGHHELPTGDVLEAGARKSDQAG